MSQFKESTSPQEQTAIQRLTIRFDEQNHRFDAIIGALSIVSNRLSQNIPTENKATDPMPKQTFEEGTLMDYFKELDRYAGLLNELETQLQKISSLV